MQQVQDQEVIENVQQQAEPQVVELSSADLERIGGGAGNANLSF